MERTAAPSPVTPILLLTVISGLVLIPWWIQMMSEEEDDDADDEEPLFLEYVGMAAPVLIPIVIILAIKLSNNRPNRADPYVRQQNHYRSANYNSTCCSLSSGYGHLPHMIDDHQEQPNPYGFLPSEPDCFKWCLLSVLFIYLLYQLPWARRF